MGLISNGTTLLDAGALAGGIATGGMKLLSTLTASSSATLDFTSGLTSTYDHYIFKFIDIHPQTDQKNLSFQVDTGTNTNYNQTITSTVFQAYHNEGDSAAVLGYITGLDLAQGTAVQQISEATGNANDECVCGQLTIFSPASTALTKHFISRTQAAEGTGYSGEQYTAGYINTTTAITRVRFKFNAGNIDSGTIKMYGVDAG